MNECGILLTCLGKALRITADNIKDGTYDTNSVMTAVNAVRAGCLGSDGNLKSVPLLLCCAERLCAVYTACLRVGDEMADTCNCIKEYCRECICAAAEVLECCHGMLCGDERDFDADIVLAALERLTYRSRNVRMRVISRHRRIFSALAELHRTDEACEMLMRCRRLMDGCVRLSGYVCIDCEEIFLQ